MQYFITAIVIVGTFAASSCRSDSTSQASEASQGDEGKVLEERPTNMPTKLEGEIELSLESGEVRHAENPDTFWIPSLQKREAVVVGDYVKLIFVFKSESDVRTERMWVEVTKKEGKVFQGVLDNQPYCTDKYKVGHEVRFETKHIINILE